MAKISLANKEKLNQEKIWDNEFQETELFKKAGSDSFSDPISPWDAYREGRKATNQQLLTALEKIKEWSYNLNNETASRTSLEMDEFLRSSGLVKPIGEN